MAKKKLSAKEKEQPPIPGAEQGDKIPVVHNAALAYKQTQQDFAEAGEGMELARVKLVERMKDNNLTHYVHGNVEVDLKVGKDRVKVKVKNAADED